MLPYHAYSVTRARWAQDVSYPKNSGEWVGPVVANDCAQRSLREINGSHVVWFVVTGGRLTYNCQCYPGYFREPHWKSMGLPEISSVTWQVCIHRRPNRRTGFDAFFNEKANQHSDINVPARAHWGKFICVNYHCSTLNRRRLLTFNLGEDKMSQLQIMWDHQQRHINFFISQYITFSVLFANVS